MSVLISSVYGRRHSFAITPRSVPDFNLPCKVHPSRWCDSIVSPWSNEGLKDASLSLITEENGQSRADLTLFGKVAPRSPSLHSSVSFNSSATTNSSEPPSPPMSIRPPLQRRGTSASPIQRYSSSRLFSSMKPSCSSIIEGKLALSCEPIGSLAKGAIREFIPSLSPSRRHAPPATAPEKRLSTSISQYFWSSPKQVVCSRTGKHSSVPSLQSSNGGAALKTQQLSSRLRAQSDSITLRPKLRQQVTVSQPTRIQDEEPTTGQDPAANTAEADPDNSIRISLSYKAHVKRLTVQIHGIALSLQSDRATRNLLVELILNPGSSRAVLRASSGLDRLPKMAVFPEVMSFSLASQTLSVKVSTRGLLPRTRQVLYESTLPLADVSLVGDANWFPMKSVHTKIASQSTITICMCYQVHKSKFVVTVVNSKNLKKSALRKGSYVEVNFLCRGDKALMQTVRTKSRRGRNPVYKEAFCLELAPWGLASRYMELTFTVRRRNFGRGDEALGRVTLSSEMLLRWKTSESLKNTLDEAFRHPGKVITQTHPLTICQKK